MKLPTSAFLHPAGDNRPEIEALLHQVVALLLDEMSRASERSPLPDANSTPSPVIPSQGQDCNELLDHLRDVVRQSMNAAHPGYIGHMDSIPSTLSMVGDLLAAALNNNMLSVEMSPVFSRIEPPLLKQIAQRFGLGEQSGGALVSGGSLGNLQAIAVARNSHFPVLEKGLASLTQAPVFFTSDVAHTSFQKAAMVLGLGSQGAIGVPSNDCSQMEPQALRQAITKAKALGQAPFCVAATAGTTVTGSIDPLETIADIAQEFGLWFHVDASYGGALAFSPQHRALLSGIERANSVTFNPQKWLYVAKTCAMVLFRDVATWHQNFQISAPYMGDGKGEWRNLGEVGIQGTRHADVLKLWLTLQHLGDTGIAEIIEHNFKLTEQFVKRVRDRPHLTLANEPQMNLICFRSKFADFEPAQQDQLNQQLQNHLLQAADIFLSLPLYRSQRWLKAVLLNPFTTAEHIDNLFAALDQFHHQHAIRHQ